MHKPNTLLDPYSFRRQDDSDDARFYQMPRLLIHVDEHASRALAAYLKVRLPAEGDILDLMSAYRSHLPEELPLNSVTGLGMNKEELSKNTELTSHVVHNLNQNPEMPFDDKQFDACTLSFSFQYLTQPVPVLRDLARLLKPGGDCHIAFSNRLFPIKAVFCWQTATDFQKAELVALCLDESGLYETPSARQVVAPGRGCDPLYVISARRKS
mgnify:CR=1 FL=1